MRYFLSILIGCFISILGHCQDLNGLWKGSLYPNATAIEKGKPIYLQLSIATDGIVTGSARNEVYNTNDYAIKTIKGTAKNNLITLNETVVAKKMTGSKTNWCRLQIQLSYNSSTGYLEGTYTSTECKNQIGKLILYQEDGTFPSEVTNPESHHWFDLLAKDIKKGLNAPKIRKLERDNFAFTPIYFDYDKSDIKTEFYDFLNRLIKVVEGHSDLRVKVTGHTDSDGSDQYNDGLSKRRAQAIIDFFVSKGLAADRLEFDFKGEKSPVDTNSTPEGRQKNRRVDFKFI